MNSFGSRLKDERNKLGLSIKDVAEKTKIRPHLIEKMEKGDFAFLPPVYISSFIRTYSELLKIPQKDINEAIDSLSATPDKPKTATNTQKTKKLEFGDETQEQPAPEKPFQKKPETNKYKQPSLITYLMYLALGLTVVALVYIIFFSGGSSQVSDFPSQQDIQTIGPDTTLVRSDRGLRDFYAQPDSIQLEAIATDTAWLSITIDGKRNEQITMYPDMKKSWAASEYFILSIGNEGAVTFIRNGETLKPFGKKGSVVRNVKITDKDVESSSIPWSGTTRKTSKKTETRKPPPILQSTDVQPSVRPFQKEEKEESEEPKEHKDFE
jgi:transcriptional regulator with XRE-family HTH domain